MLEGNEGKDIAQEKRIEAFIEDIIILAKKCKENNNGDLTYNNLHVTFNKQTKSYTVYFNRTNIKLATVKEGKIIDADKMADAINNFNRFSELANKKGVAHLERPEGLPEAEAVEQYFEKQRQEEIQKGKDAEESEEETDKKADGDEKDDPEKKKEEENEEEKSGTDLKKDATWIEVANDREVNMTQTFAKVLKDKGYGSFDRYYIRPNPNDQNSFDVIGQKKGEFTKISLEQIEGRNPSHESFVQLGKDDEHTREDTPIQILKIDNETGIAIFNGGRYNTTVEAYRRDKATDNYVSSEISSSTNQKAMHDADEEVRRFMDETKSTDLDYTRKMDRYYALVELEEKELPDKVNPAKDEKGIEVSEVEKTREEIIAIIAQAIQREYPEYENHYPEAKKIAEDVLIEGKSFDRAREDNKPKDKSEREPGGFGPWDNPRSRR